MNLNEMGKAVLTPRLLLSLGVKNGENGKECAQKSVSASCNICLWKIALCAGSALLLLHGYLCARRIRAERARSRMLSSRIRKARDHMMKKIAH